MNQIKQSLITPKETKNDFVQTHARPLAKPIRLKPDTGPGRIDSRFEADTGLIFVDFGEKQTNPSQALHQTNHTQSQTLKKI